MEHMDTMTSAIAELEVEGYVAQLSIDDEGAIISSDQRWNPAEVTVERIVRFEGMSNPDDESMILAVSATGMRGTLVLPYGPDITGGQADTVRSLVASR